MYILLKPVLNLTSVKHNKVAIKTLTTLSVNKARKVAHWCLLVIVSGVWVVPTIQRQEITLIKSNCVKYLIEYLSVVNVSDV